MFEAKILCMLETLKARCEVWDEVCYISCIYMTDLTSFFLFLFIFQLLSIFMVAINTVKIELINTTHNYLHNIFYISILLPTELFLIYPICMRSRSKDVDIIWTNILCNILSIEWELKIVYQQNFLVQKKISFLLFSLSFAINVW